MNDDNAAVSTQVEETAVSPTPGESQTTQTTTAQETGSQAESDLAKRLEALEKDLKKARQEAAGHRVKLREYEDATKTEEERKAARLAELETETQRLATEAQAAKRTAAIVTAAAETGVKVELARRLLTAEELEADADGEIKPPVKRLRELMKEFNLVTGASETNVSRHNTAKSSSNAAISGLDALGVGA